MRVLLRAENGFIALAAVLIYGLTGGSWWLFLLLFLAPDLSMLGYLAGPRIGAWCYNTVHSWIAVVLLGLTSLVLAGPLPMQLTLILAAHIAVDRALGFGLKHMSGFKDTHLGRIGGG